MKTDKQKLMPNAGSRIETKAMKNALKAMRDADSLETFFIAMHAMLITPEYKNFKVTKFHSKTGKPKSGTYVVDKASMPIHFYFAKDSTVEKMKLGADVRAFLIENVPKRGTFLLHVASGVISVEYKQVLVFSDHFINNYEIQLVASAVRSQFHFGETE